MALGTVTELSYIHLDKNIIKFDLWVLSTLSWYHQWSVFYTQVCNEMSHTSGGCWISWSKNYITMSDYQPL
jgi:hypothetical protein